MKGIYAYVLSTAGLGAFLPCIAPDIDLELATVRLGKPRSSYVLKGLVPRSFGVPLVLGTSGSTQQVETFHLANW